METKTTGKNKNIINIIRNILLLFIFFAVCGWIYEVIWTYFDDGVWTNRGYLFGPWLPIYGFGGMLIYGIFHKQIKKPVYIGKLNIRFLLLFVYICLITTVVELAATYIIELFGTPFTVLWDYSDHFMNFQGRVCLDASARFGALGLMIIYGALPLYNKFVHMKNQKVLNVIAWTVIAVFAIDWILRIPLGNNYTGPV
jgi:uncharacterized membrane protein